MQRRNFIKSAICLSCLGVVSSGCDFNFKTSGINNSLKNDKFYYKSEEDLPKRIQIEACSLCQLNCPQCPVGRNMLPKQYIGYLKFKDFKNFIDNHTRIEKIELSNNGEIFLNPELDDIIKYAHHKGVMLSASGGVNFNTVSEATLENLVKYKFTKLTIALDGATPETYAIYRRGGDFNKVIRNIERVNYYKKKYNSDYPRMVWQFIVFGHNEHEIELAQEKAKKLGMTVKYKKNNTPQYSPVKNKTRAEKLTGLNFSKKNCSLTYCQELFDCPHIDFDGKLLGCCRIMFNSGFKINVFKDGLFASLNAPEYIYAKHMLTDLSAPARQNIPCAHCEEYAKLKKQHRV